MSGGKALRVIAVLAVLALSVSGPLSVGSVQAASSFVFSSAGDFGIWTGFEETLRQLGRTHSDFAIALGDLSYVGNESAWCDQFRRSFPSVMIVAGNHELGLRGEIGGDINEFIRHCPWPLEDVEFVGVYGKQFYFDYPQPNPLARFILISPGLEFVVDGGEYYYYREGDARYNWTRDAIDGARAAGIPWLFLGSHKNCLGAGEHHCEIGTDIFNLALERKVDIYLQAHNHYYDRSKQLALGEGCPGIVAHAYDEKCVSNPGSDGEYTKGEGTVVVTAGMGGRDIIEFNMSDPLARYAAAWSPDPLALGKGVATFTVSADRLTMETHTNGTYRDRFTMIAPPAPLSLFEALPRGVPFVAPVVVIAEIVVIAWIVARRPKRRSVEARPAPQPSSRRRPATSAGMANGGTGVKLQGRRFVLDESGALRLED
jgi:hypothetical protein